MIFDNIDTKDSTEHGFGYCPVCGEYQLFLSYEPIDTQCKRNTFECQNCGSAGRNRHVAYAILNEFHHRANCANLSEFAAHFDGNIWITCVKEAVSRNLGDHGNVIRSEYVDSASSGQIHGEILCQDIQATSFADGQFDLIISEDVLEHVPDPAKAFREIGRLLHPGGKHVFTIPIDWSAPRSYARAVIENGGVRHIHPPEMHGDPFRPDGVLAFYTFGHDVIERFCSLTGPTRMLAAHGDRMMETGFQIRNSWVFVSEKAA